MWISELVDRDEHVKMIIWGRGQWEILVIQRLIVHSLLHVESGFWGPSQLTVVVCMIDQRWNMCACLCMYAVTTQTQVNSKQRSRAGLKGHGLWDGLRDESLPAFVKERM